MKIATFNNMKRHRNKDYTRESRIEERKSHPFENGNIPAVNSFKKYSTLQPWPFSSNPTRSTQITTYTALHKIATIPLHKNHKHTIQP